MFTLRKADKSDCPLINQLAKDIFPVTYSEILSPEQLEYMFDWMYSTGNIEKQMNNGHTYFIGYDNKKPFGYISIEQESQNIFHLQKIYVLPQLQGTGAGRFLFDSIIRYIKEIHPSPCTVELNVNRDNKAYHFYVKMGMKKVREGNFPIGSGYYMNDYIMAIDI